ncbi:hypothetical protein ACEQ8H_001560 [Pleosporales sp. CAS-2024a]
MFGATLGSTTLQKPPLSGTHAPKPHKTTMSANPSHHLPMNSIIFRSTAHLVDPHTLAANNPTLVNLADAADATVTALPTPPPRPRRPRAVRSNKAAWHRIVAKVRNVLDIIVNNKKKK